MDVPEINVNHHNHDDSSFGITAIAPVVVGIIMLLYCFRRTGESQPNQEPEKTREERIATIESKLIIRTVLAKDDDSGRAIPTGDESAPAPKSRKFGKSNRVCSSFVAAALTRNSSWHHHQLQFSEPLPRAKSAPSLINLSSDQQEQTTNEAESEEDTTIEQPPSSRQQSKHTARNNYEHPTTCDICLMDYQVGDQVAWSNNDACVHAFHKECIRDWLLRSPHCPLCRADYLEGEGCHHGSDHNV